jgi:hypothetical protein
MDRSAPKQSIIESSITHYLGRQRIFQLSARPPRQSRAIAKPPLAYHKVDDCLSTSCALAFEGTAIGITNDVAVKARGFEQRGAVNGSHKSVLTLTALLIAQWARIR